MPKDNSSHGAFVECSYCGAVHSVLRKDACRSALLSLDVEAPSEVARVLRNAADAFYNSATELSVGWQSEVAGRPWALIAHILDDAAERCERIAQKGEK